MEDSLELGLRKLSLRLGSGAAAAGLQYPRGALPTQGWMLFWLGNWLACSSLWGWDKVDH